MARRGVKSVGLLSRPVSSRALAARGARARRLGSGCPIQPEIRHVRSNPGRQGGRVPGPARRGLLPDAQRLGRRHGEDPGGLRVPGPGHHQCRDRGSGRAAGLRGGAEPGGDDGGGRRDRRGGAAAGQRRSGGRLWPDARGLCRDHSAVGRDGAGRGLDRGPSDRRRRAALRAARGGRAGARGGRGGREHRHPLHADGARGVLPGRASRPHGRVDPPAQCLPGGRRPLPLRAGGQDRRGDRYPGPRGRGADQRGHGAQGRAAGHGGTDPARRAPGQHRWLAGPRGARPGAPRRGRDGPRRQLRLRRAADPGQRAVAVLQGELRPGPAAPHCRPWA